MQLILQLVLDGIVHGCALGLIAMTFSYIYVTTGIFHVAHAGILTLGGYLAWYFTGVGVPFPVLDREAPLGSGDFAERERLCNGPGSGISCLYLDTPGEVRVFFSEG